MPRYAADSAKALEYHTVYGVAFCLFDSQFGIAGVRPYFDEVSALSTYTHRFDFVFPVDFLVSLYRRQVDFGGLTLRTESTCQVIFQFGPQHRGQ